MALKSISGKDVNLSRAFKDIKVDFAKTLSQKMYLQFLMTTQ
ncbi:MAG: hypothetical protein CM15mV11_0060 [Caudoviricetes sp.]|nr:MAG: hypothetical protein CM15mV11_0060 [Caudoviricetes sp.]